MENKPSISSELLWRRKFSAPERARLQHQPALELEARLTAALTKISDTPVPTNFTTRVLAAIDREDAQASRSQSWTLNWRRLWPRVAVAAAVLIFAGLSIQRFENSSHRQAMAKSVALVASAKSLPSVDALENLEAIQRMSQSASADGELLAALQ